MNLTHTYIVKDPLLFPQEVFINSHNEYVWPICRVQNIVLGKHQGD